MMALARVLDIAERRAGLLLSAVVIASLLIVSLLRGSLGIIGPDGDDVMRLVQVQALLDGQDWYDVTQARLGPAGGTEMHWSRLADLPMAVIAGLLTPVIGEAGALQAAITVWPPLSVLIVISGLMFGARAFGGRGVLLFTAVIGFGVLFQHFRFLPGAIDHHNLQLGLLMLPLGCLAAPRRPPRLMALAGASLAAAVAVGAEVYPFAGALALFVAADWALAGAVARRGTAAFGAAFAAVLAATFVLTTAPASYGVVRCDAHSSLTLLAGFAGGAGLALAAWTLSSGPARFRLGALAVTGALCAGLILVAGPQCLGNPLSSLSPASKSLWLARVDEARPVLALLDGQVHEVLFRLGTLVLGLGAALLLAARPGTRRAGLLFVLVLIVALAFSLYQTRFYVFGQLFAVLPLAVIAARLQARELAPSLPRPAYLFALLLSVPMMWSAAGLILAPPATALAAQPAATPACDAAATYTALDALPPGRLLAPASDAPGLLLSTRHSTLHGHYHRNTAGIDAALAIYTSTPAAARSLIAAAGVDYVVVCPADEDLGFFARHTPGGLVADLVAGRPPAWLVPVNTGETTTIYRVTPG